MVPKVIDYWSARQAFEHNRVFVVDKKLSWWSLVELLKLGKIVVMSHRRFIDIIRTHTDPDRDRRDTHHRPPNNDPNSDAEVPSKP